MQVDYEGLESSLGYRFHNRHLAQRALTHRSWIAEQNGTAVLEDNEQLEFLGDSILGFVVSLALINHYPNAREGDLSRWKSHFVSATHLHQCALKLDLGVHLILGKGEDRSGGRTRKTLLANAMEALIAAIHSDSGLQEASSFIERCVLDDDLESISETRLHDHKNALQDLLKNMGLPQAEYKLVETGGPDHARTFLVELKVGSDHAVRAEGTSKKGASQKAAALLLTQFARGPAFSESRGVGPPLSSS